jgi:hypothetical protein
LPINYSTGPGYTLQLLFNEKYKKMPISQQPMKEEKNNHRFGYLRILENF